MASMVEETLVLKENGTWTLTDLPLKKRATRKSGFTNSNSKWMELANVIRLVFLQKVISNKKAFIFTRPSGPIAKLVTVWFILSAAVLWGYPFHQLDKNMLSCMKIWTRNFKFSIPSCSLWKGETRVCKLKKKIYGVKQTSWICCKVFHYHGSSRISQSKPDYSLFPKITPQIQTMFLFILTIS